MAIKDIIFKAIGAIISFIVPFQVVINIAYKHGWHDKIRFILYDGRSANMSYNWDYKPYISGKIYDINSYMCQELLVVDDATTKEGKIKRLEEELAKLKEN